jgi:hypothetical protein
MLSLSTPVFMHISANGQWREGASKGVSTNNTSFH